jgi:acyl phosphate:glycerol-3-phosphate acyltransferase
MRPWLGLVAAYVLGSIPWAYLAGRAIKGIDLRTVGSGNLGATNVYRSLGAPVAAVVLLLDAAKGFVPARFFAEWTQASPPELWAIAFGVAAIVGHVRPVFLLWKGGGKGVASAAGVFLALAPVPVAIAIAAFVAVVALFRYVSLGSIVAAAVLPLATLAVAGPRAPLFYVALGVCLFVCWTHRGNIARLRRGEEPKFGRRAMSGGTR